MISSRSQIRFFVLLFPLIAQHSAFAQQVTVTCFRAGEAYEGRLDVNLTAKLDELEETVPESTIRYRKGLSGPISDVIKKRGPGFRVESDANGTFVLLFNQPDEDGDGKGDGVSFPNSNELKIVIDVDGGRGNTANGVTALVGQLATADDHDFTVVLNGAVLSNAVGSAALSGDGVNRAIVVPSSSTAAAPTFLLTEDSGTAFFPSRAPAPAAVMEEGVMKTKSSPLQYQVQSLELSGGSDNYLFYREKDSNGRWWAFGKSQSVACKCVNGRWQLVKSGNRIYYWNREVSKKWVFFGYGTPTAAVREMPNPQVQASLKARAKSRAASQNPK